jgi:hypothetical protein
MVQGKKSTRIIDRCLDVPGASGLPANKGCTRDSVKEGGVTKECGVMN